MPRWKRTAKDRLIKSRRMTDGEILHLLVGTDSASINSLDVEIYASLQNVRSFTLRTVLWCVAAAVFAVLSHFGVLKTASAAGLELAPQVYAHAALIAVSATGAAFCLSFSKLTFLQSWFARKFTVGSPKERAELLLRFADAYWYFSYLPGVIGYPKHIHAARSAWAQLASLALVLIVLFGLCIASIWLWIALANAVRISAHFGHTISWLTLGVSGALILMGWLAPFRYDIPQKYAHFGMVHLLSRLSGEKSRQAHLRIIRVAEKMGLLDD